jgi:hypothetical protein
MSFKRVASCGLRVLSFWSNRFDVTFIVLKKGFIFDETLFFVDDVVFKITLSKSEIAPYFLLYLQ